MATGEGTGTPAAAADATTLATLRARLKTQLMHAGGMTEPLTVNVSAETLTTLSDRVELTLFDAANERYAAADVEEAIEKAIDQYSLYSPHHLLDSVTLSSAGREVDISSLTDLVRVEKVWWDYDSSDPAFPPNWREFEVWPGSILYINDVSAPESGDKVRIWYTAAHELNGLNAATATTIPAEDIAFIISGAAHFALQARAADLSETLTVDSKVVDRLLELANEYGKNFRYGVRQQIPYWQRSAYAYDQNDLDEAIRWALAEYNAIYQNTTETTIDLTADGREIDIASLSALTAVISVWAPYDVADPVDPPRYRSFAVRPGHKLYIADGDEPADGDTVRIAYKHPFLIDGLDSATDTTLPDPDHTLLLTGASAHAAQERVQDMPGRWVQRKVAEWASLQLRQFKAGLKTLARDQALQHSGPVPMTYADSWRKHDRIY